MRRLIWLVVAALLLALAGGQDAHGQAPPPNVVLIVSDDQTYPSLAKMPFVDGRDDWMRFSRAYINDATCCPSRATILSGQYSHHTGVETSHDGENFDPSSTIATWLDPTYETAFFGKYLNGYPFDGDASAIPPGWDRWDGFVGDAEYYDYELNVDGTVEAHAAAPADYSTDVLRHDVVDLIDQASAPFFVYFAPKGPHAPFTPAPGDVGLFDGAPVDHPPNFDVAASGAPQWWANLAPTNADRQDQATRDQWATLQSVDDSVRAIFAALHRRGELNNTVVVYISDNGISLGSHRWSGKLCAYEECDHVPLLARGPGVSPGPNDALVGNVDLAPTIAALTGVTPATSVDGLDLRPLLDRSAGSLRHAVLLRCGPARDPADDVPECWGVRTERYKYVETVATGERELYDETADPYELANLDGRPEYAAREDALARRLAKLRR